MRTQAASLAAFFLGHRMELKHLALVWGFIASQQACERHDVEARLREEAGRSGEVGTMVALAVWQSALAKTTAPTCPARSAHIRLEGRLVEGPRELRRWEEERSVEINDDGLIVDIRTSLWNEIGLENTQHTILTLQDGWYRWSAPLIGESFERPEDVGDRDRMMAYGHGFKSILEDVPECVDPVFDATWKARMGVYGQPVIHRPGAGVVEAIWHINTRVLELRLEDIQVNDRPR